MAALPTLSSTPNATMTPVPGSSDTPVIDAWKEAREKYKKTLSKKDQLQVQITTGPADVVKEIESWHLKVNNSKSTKFAAAVGGGLARLQRFTASIDMLAQGSPAPGCLLWGSIKFALTIVQHAVEEYERLCKALTRMIECLPRVELYSESFLDSSLVCGCVDAFYISVLQFWSRACKFYRRGRFWNFIRTGWKDYDTEFRKLEQEMVENGDRIEKSALAEHIGQSKVARIHQKDMGLSLLEAQNSTRKKEIIAWLSPSAYDVKYYQKDFEAAIKMRHPNTCQWLLENAEFTQFSATDASEEQLLWIYAKPGAGKTVLASYLIEYYRKRATTHMSNTVLYFFCKNLDEDKNSDIAIIRSLLYQMLQSIENHVDYRALSDDLGTTIDESGKQRAMDFATMWQLFTAHISKLIQPVIILDALDECREPKMLVQKLTNLSKSNGIKVILTSRKEFYLSKMLGDKLCLEIRPEDVDADIKALIEAKVSKQPLLCHNLVRDKVIKNLSEAHAGMFLWVYLMLKELKACRSVEQVEDTLRKLPEGLPAIYISILRRLCKSLKSPALDLAKKVFVWVVSAIRPLRIEEISEALTFHYKVEGHTLLSDEQLFPYANKDIELVCGSLLTVRDGTIQVIHLTVKEFLGDTEAWTDPPDSYTQLLVDPSSANLQLTLVSLKYISQKLAEPLVDPDASERLSEKTDELRAMKLSDRLKQSPFAEYASFDWLIHLVDCEGFSGDIIVEAFQGAFDSKATFCWIEMCLTLDRSSFHRICLGLGNVIEWADDNMQYAPRSINQYTYLKNWCSTILHVIDDMGSALHPEDIYFLDFSEAFRSNGLGRTYDDHGHFVAREIRTFFGDSQSHLAVQAHTSSRNPLQPRTASSELGIFIYDHTRQVFITADKYLEHNHEVLHVQDVKTGRRLPSVIDPEESFSGYITSSTMSHDGKYLGIVYVKFFRSGNRNILTSIWQIDFNLEFKKSMRSGSWARKVLSVQLNAEACVYAPIVYGDDEYFYSPVGRIHPASSTVDPFPSLVPKMDTRVLMDPDRTERAYFSTKGDLFVQDPEDSQGSVIRYLIQEPESREHHLLLKARLIAVSPIGCYLIFFYDDREEIRFDLYDTTSKESFSVPHIKCKPEYCVFKFSEDENRVFCFASNDREAGEGLELEALVMDLGGNTPRVRGYGKCISSIRRVTFIRRFSSGNISICDDEDMAWLVTIEGEVYSVDLSTPEILFPNGLMVTEDFPHHHSQISKDGTSLNMLHYEKTQAYVRKFNLSMPEQAARRFDLGGEFNWLAWKEFSQDGSILLNGMNLYHLPNMNMNMNDDNEYEDQLIAIEPILVAPPLDNLSGFRVWPRRDFRVWIWHDKDPVAYVSWYHDEAGLSLYRVHLDIPSSVQLDIPPFIHMTNFSLEFHPSLPLALLSYRNPDKNELIVKTLDLIDLNIKSVQIHKGVLEAIKLDPYSSQTPRFSDCGTHINLNPLCFGRLQTEPRPARILHNGRSLIMYKDTFVLQVFLRGLIRIGFSKAHPPPLSDDDSDLKNSDQWIRETRDESVSSVPLTSYPECIEHAMTTILLGSTDHDLMRIVFVSQNGRLEMKTLLWTFNEVRSRLIDKWEKRELERGRTSSSKEIVFINDKLDKSPNKDLSPSDLITWYPGCKWNREILESGSESESDG